MIAWNVKLTLDHLIETSTFWSCCPFKSWQRWCHE